MPLAGVRDSTVLSEGLSKMCLEVGFDDWDTEDFQMQVRWWRCAAASLRHHLQPAGSLL